MSESEKFIKKYKTEVAFGILLVLTLVSAGLNGGFQSNFGKIDVREVKIRSNDGRMLVGKLYLPDGVNAANPAPGVLAIHGYNNDKDVQRPHTIELAKHGIVVLDIDALDQGDSDKGDFVFGASSIPFEAYEWLENQTFVNSNKTGVVGHSMGAFFASAVAMTYPQIDVLGYQAFSPRDFNASIAYLHSVGTNVIQISSGREEFGGRTWDQSPSDWKAYCETWIESNTAKAGIGDGTGEFFKTYGDVASGGAQRYVWLPKTHPGQTHDITATREITQYFLATLLDISEAQAASMVGSLTYYWADFFGAASALFLMLSIIPLAGLLLKTKPFVEVKQPMPEIKESLQTKKWVWWVFASVNFILGGLVYMFATDAPPADGEGIQKWIIDANNIAKWTPAYDMAIANGFLGFYVVNALITVVLLVLWYFAFMRKRGGNLKDFAVYDPDQKPKQNFRILGKTIVMAIAIFLYMYAIVYFANWLWTVEIRGPWSMFKLYTLERALRFWLYYPGVLFFWIINAGAWLFGLMRMKEYKSEGLTVFIWWLKICFAMLTGLILLNIINYAPTWFNTGGPLFQNPNLFPDGFAPMYLLQTWAFIPIAAVMFLIAIYYFRKTGRIWLGAIVLAMMGTWLMVTGTVMDPYVL